MNQKIIEKLFWKKKKGNKFDKEWKKDEKTLGKMN